MIILRETWETKETAIKSAMFICHMTEKIKNWLGDAKETKETELDTRRWQKITVIHFANTSYHEDGLVYKLLCDILRLSPPNLSPRMWIYPEAEKLAGFFLSCGLWIQPRVDYQMVKNKILQLCCSAVY